MGSPTDRVYTDTHEWIMTGANPAKSGITRYLASRIGTANAVALPDRKTRFTRGQDLGTIAGAMRSHTYHGVLDGSVIDCHEILMDGPGTSGHPNQITTDPFGTGDNGGWLVSIQIADISQLCRLMTAEEYDAKYPVRQLGASSESSAAMLSPLDI